MGEGYDMGFQLGSALAKGVVEWKEIQRDRQQRREFEGAMGLAAQRRGMIKSAAAVEEAQMLEQIRAQIQRSPGAEQTDRPTGNVREDGSPETEQVIRTAEGDIPVQQLLMLKQRKQQAESMAELAEVDLIMEMQARYPENRYIKQWVASTYAGIQQKQQIRSKQVEAQRLQLDTLAAGLQREQFEQEKLKYREQPERQERAAATENALGMQRDASRIELQKRADLEVEGERAKNKPEKPATEFVKKLQQMAPRAVEALEQLDALEVDRSGVGLGAQTLLPNAVRTSKRQQIDQAAGQFVNSVLRAESGATITESEIEKAKRQYIPQLGDSEEVIAQKRQARRTAVENLFRAAELEPPALGARDRDPAAGGGWTPEGIRQAMRAGKLTRDQAIEMIEKLNAQ